MNTKIVFLGFVFQILFNACFFAQERDVAKPQILIRIEQNDGTSGRIELQQSERIENMLKMQIANNRLQNGIPGYRIRIFSHSAQTARQSANEVRVEFMRHFPELEAYQEYNTPNWQIFVGNFRTKNEAIREKKRIEKIFPGSFIVNSMIDIYK